MAYLHRDDPNAARYGARIRDLSGATRETIVNVPGGLSVGALRWAPNCEFLVVAVVGLLLWALLG